MKNGTQLIVFSMLCLLSISAVVQSQKQVKHKRLYTISIDSQNRKGCLDEHGGGEAQAYPCNGGSYQKWWAKEAGDGWIFLQSFRSYNYLDSNHEGHTYTHPGNGGSFQMWKKTADGLKNKATEKFLSRSIFTDTVSTVSINTDQFWHFEDITPEFDCMAMNENIGNQDGILVIGKGFVGTCWSIQYWRNPNGGVTVGAQCWTDDRNNSKWSTMDWNAFQECL